MSLNKYLSFTGLACTLSFGFLSAAAQPPVERRDVGSIAAIVDGHTILASEVEKSAMQRYGQDILDGLINDFLIERESERLHLSVPAAEIDHQVQMLVAAIKPKTLEEGLKQHHQTLAELREDFRRRILALKLAAIDAPPGRFVHAHVILTTISSDVKRPTQISKFDKSIEAGTNFEDLGIIFEGSASDAKLVQAALQLKPGQILDQPIQTPSGYYVIKVSSTDSEHPANEDAIYSEAKKQYEMRQGAQNLPKLLQKLRAHATVKLSLNP